LVEPVLCGAAIGPTMRLELELPGHGWCNPPAHVTALPDRDEVSGVIMRLTPQSGDAIRFQALAESLHGRIREVDPTGRYT
jgi:hypothetical protein